MLGGLLGGSNKGGEADWSLEQPEKAEAVRKDIITAAKRNGKEGVIHEKGDLSKEDAAAVIFQQAERKFEVTKNDIEEAQHIIDSEFEKIEEETREGVKGELNSSNPEKAEQKLEQGITKEEQRMPDLEKKVDEYREEIENSEKNAYHFFEIALGLTERPERRAEIKRYLKNIRKIEQYKIVADFEIEIEDVEELLEDLEEILHNKNIRDKEPQALTEEIKSAIKQYSQDKTPVERLGFVSSD